jgi:hypothetical protein
MLARLAFALALACGCTAQSLELDSLRTITLGAAPSTTSGLRYFVCGNVSSDGVVISVNQAKVAVSEASSSSGWRIHYTEDLSLMLSSVYTTPQLLGGGCTQSLLVLNTRCGILNLSARRWHCVVDFCTGTRAVVLFIVIAVMMTLARVALARVFLSARGDRTVAFSTAMLGRFHVLLYTRPRINATGSASRMQFRVGVRRHDPRMSRRRL